MTSLVLAINNFFRDKGLNANQQNEGATTYWVYAFANQFVGWVSLSNEDESKALNISLDIGLINLEGDSGIALLLLDVNCTLPNGFRIFTTFNEYVGVGTILNWDTLSEPEITEYLDLVHQIGFRVREVAGVGISPLPNNLLLNAQKFSNIPN